MTADNNDHLEQIIKTFRSHTEEMHAKTQMEQEAIFLKLKEQLDELRKKVDAIGGDKPPQA